MAPFTTAAGARRLLVLLGLIPLPDMTQTEVEYQFRVAIEDSGVTPESTILETSCTSS